MNQRKAKALRGLARARSVGMPERKLVRQKIGSKLVHPLDGHGKVDRSKVIRVDTFRTINSAGSTRGVYRFLKKQEARA